MIPSPSLLRLELSSDCQLSCIMCSCAKNRYRNYLSPALLENVFSDLEFCRGLATVELHGTGEPLMHPEFSRICRMIAGNAPQVRLSMSTNCAFLSSEVSEEIISSDSFSFLTFSIDAATELTYDKIRAGGFFLQTVSNIKKFIRMRNLLKKKTPLIILQFVVLEKNFHEAVLFISFWRDFFNSNGLEIKVFKEFIPEFCCDSILLIPDCRFDSEGDFNRRFFSEIPDLCSSGSFIPEYYQFRNPAEKRPCPFPFFFLNISASGHVTPCCLGWPAAPVMGDIHHESISRIWSGELYKNLRKKHVEGSASEISACSTCRVREIRKFSEVFFPEDTGSGLEISKRS